MAVVNLTLLAGIFISALSVVRAWDVCYVEYNWKYCEHGCCDNNCCSAEAALIVGAVIGGLILLAVIIGLIILCVYLVHQKKKRAIHSQGHVIQPSTGVVATSTTSGAYPAPPPQGMVYYQQQPVGYPNPHVYGVTTMTTTTNPPAYSTTTM